MKNYPAIHKVVEQGNLISTYKVADMYKNAILSRKNMGGTNGRGGPAFPGSQRFSGAEDQ